MRGMLERGDSQKKGILGKRGVSERGVSEREESRKERGLGNYDRHRKESFKRAAW